MTTPLHEEQCFTCWLGALGVDPKLAGAIIGGAFSAGFGAGLGTVGLPPAIAQQVQRPALDLYTLGVIESFVRTTMAAPMSPDVAAAANGHGHG